MALAGRIWPADHSLETAGLGFCYMQKTQAQLSLTKILFLVKIYCTDLCTFFDSHKVDNYFLVLPFLSHS